MLILKGEGAGLMLMGPHISACARKCDISRVTKTDDINLHLLQILIKGLVLGQHLNMLRVQFELGHCIDRAYSVLLHQELVDLLCNYVAFAITLWLNLHPFSVVLLLNILILHNVV